MKTYKKNSDYRNIKVKFEHQEDFEPLQLLLFKHGCFWGGDMSQKLISSDPYINSIFVNESGRMTYGTSGGSTPRYFDDSENEEAVFVQAITYSLKAPKVESVEIDGAKYSKSELLALIGKSDLKQLPKDEQ